LLINRSPARVRGGEGGTKFMVGVKKFFGHRKRKKLPRWWKSEPEKKGKRSL